MNKPIMKDERFDSFSADMNGNALPRNVRLPVRTKLEHYRYLWSKYDIGNILLIIVLAGLLGIIETIEPHHRYIMNISDPSINYPLVNETVPSWMLIPLVGIIPIGCILAIHFYQRYNGMVSAKRELYYVLFGYFYSLVLTLLMTSFIKHVAGRPRPNFVQLSGYQPDGTFTGTPHNISNAYQSFPSGHTSSAFAGLGYLSLYFIRLSFPSSNFHSRELGQDYHVNQGWKTVICLLPIGLATFIGLTRIVDYFHGFDDVSIGALLGLLICSLTFQLHVGWWWKSLHQDRTNRSLNGRTYSVATAPIDSDAELSATPVPYETLPSPHAGPVKSNKANIPGIGLDTNPRRPSAVEEHV